MKIICRFILFLMLALLITSCGQDSAPETLIVSGRLEGSSLEANPGKPLLVAVLRHDPHRAPNLSSLDDVVLMVSADKADFSFRIDLTESGLGPGDAINLLAFADLNFGPGLPSPDAGDTVGFYIDEETFSPACTLQTGLNEGITIRVNRVIQPYRTLISGTVEDSPAGEILIVAYAGDIDSLDFTNWDVDQAVGYVRQVKGSEIGRAHV
jgi:hypothetical protein